MLPKFGLPLLTVPSNLPSTSLFSFELCTVHDLESEESLQAWSFRVGIGINELPMLDTWELSRTSHSSVDNWMCLSLSTLPVLASVWWTYTYTCAMNARQWRLHAAFAYFGESFAAWRELAGCLLKKRWLLGDLWPWALQGHPGFVSYHFGDCHNSYASVASRSHRFYNHSDTCKVISMSMDAPSHGRVRAMA